MNSNVVDQAFQQEGGSTPAVDHLIDSIPALIAWVDCNMFVHCTNTTFDKWFTRSLESGKLFPIIVGEQIFHQVQRHLGHVITGTHASFQIVSERVDGLRFLDVQLTPHFNANQTVKGFVFHATDATEKHKSERTLRDYFENASVGLHWVNGEGIIIWANPAELQMLGYEREEYIGHNIAEFHANNEVISDILTRLKQHETIKNYEAEMICKDGARRYVSINSSALWEGGNFVHTRCFTIDITDQKLATQASKENQQRFEMTADLVPVVIWTSDAAGKWNYVNVRWREVTGITLDHGEGDRWVESIHVDDREKILDSWRRSIALRTSFEAKFRLANKTGNYTVYYVHAIPRLNASHQYIGHVGILQDISTQEQIKSSLEKIVLERTDDLRTRNAELRAAEDSLRDKNRELEVINNQLSSFAYVASHDLQEPLRKIQTYTSRILHAEGSTLTEAASGFLHRIMDSANRMRVLIEDLLTFSRSTAQLEYEETKLDDIFNEVVTELELKIDDKGAVVENQGLPILKVVRFHFFQLLQNLIGNSLKFTAENRIPHIVVRSEKVSAEKIPEDFPKVSGEYYHIEVVDNGIGFDSEQNAKIFEVFHRLHGKDKFEGTGIGLAICKRIVEHHRGILIANGEINNGATFHIYIPIDDISGL